ncbi:MAG: polysaccharide pyruvyl transferase family protein [Nitrospirae bacterium]|nr:polysaccharide pyruvyl transferase family protein [Nitrospirota bacterium]
MGISLIKVLRKHFPGYKINYVSSHAREDIIEKAYPFIRAKYPDVEILPFPLPARADNYDTRNPYLRRAKSLLWVVRTILSIFHVIFPSSINNRTLKEIKESAIVISRGTNILYDKKGKLLQSMVSIYWLCFPLLMAWRLRKPYVIYAQSFGPLHNPVNRCLVNFVFNRSEMVLPREELSESYIKGLGINPNKIRLVPDSVFGLDSPREEQVKAACSSYNLPFKKYLVLVVRELMNKEESISDMFPLLKDTADFMLGNDLIEKCVIVTQCSHFEGYRGFESDSDISRELYDFMRKDNPEKFQLIDRPLSPDELLNIYGGGRYMVTVRLHAAIFSLVAGTPAMAVSYWGFKTKGIFRMLNMQEFVMASGEITTTNLRERLQRIEQNYQRESERITGIISETHERALQTPLLFGHILKA